MTIIEFLEHFPDENSCKLHFKEQREKLGIVCKKCGCEKHYWLAPKWQWQCTSCRFRTTLRSGTVMESAKLPFYKWYLCMAFMTSTKKGISALEMQRQLGHKRYGTVWKLMHKIRSGMGKRDSLYQLNGSVEFDEGYFEKATSEAVNLKRGRGSQRQSNVAIMAESTPLENIENGKIDSHCRYFKMKVLESHNKEEINQVVVEYINQNAVIFSDKSTSYVDFKELVETHISVKSDKKVTKTTLKWVHIAISNAKRNLLGVYHMIKATYLQSYLNEFCYKLNRRYFGEKLFSRLIIATIGN
jgi:transposase-like protein